MWWQEKSSTLILSPPASRHDFHGSLETISLTFSGDMPLEWLEARCPALVGWVVWKSSLAVCNIIFLQDTFDLLCNWHSAHEKDVGSCLHLVQLTWVYFFLFKLVYHRFQFTVSLILIEYLLALFSREAFFSETSHFESNNDATVYSRAFGALGQGGPLTP